MNNQEQITQTEEVAATPVGEPEQENISPVSGERSLDFAKDPKITAYIEEKINEGIQKALQGKPPKANTTDPTEQEKKNFEKMTYKERLTLFNSNPHIYNKLTKGIN